MVGKRGILRIYLFKDIAILAGCGVGGGSLVYANTLYVPSREFFTAEEWRSMQDWESSLAPHYEEAKRMLGAAEVPFENDADKLYRRLLSRLYSGEFDALEILKLKEVADQLEEAADAFEHVANVVETIAVKES